MGDENSVASVVLKIKSFNVAKPFSNSESDCFHEENKGIVPLLYAAILIHHGDSCAVFLHAFADNGGGVQRDRQGSFLPCGCRRPL